jgi:GntR family transcriptional regulator
LTWPSRNAKLRSQKEVDMPEQAEERGSLLEDYADQTQIELVTDSQIPLYFQLARILQRFIRETSIPAGNQFPSEETIGACFGVSRPTVNKAIQELLNQGWLRRVRGKGTFVEEDPRVQLRMLSDNMSPVEQFPPGAVSYRLINRQILEASVDIAAGLAAEPGTPTLFLRRLRVLHDHPLCLCDSYLPASRFPGLGEAPFVRGSLYATLEEVYDCHLERSVRWVEASEVVEGEAAELLGIPLLSPILLLSGVTYCSKAGEPIEVIRSRFREGISLESTVTRDALRRRPALHGRTHDAPPTEAA